MKPQFIQSTTKEALSMLEKGISHEKILAHLVQGAEKISGRGSVSSILVLDKNGLLRNGSSPRLPLDYLLAIDGLKPDANVGTCAAAAATGSIVITRDFYEDSKWAELRHLPLALGFVSAWSHPIKNEGGKVLGTFGAYFTMKREPSREEIEGVRILSDVAAKVLLIAKK
jgi:GAF domain-containing protein